MPISTTHPLLTLHQADEILERIMRTGWLLCIATSLITTASAFSQPTTRPTVNLLNLLAPDVSVPELLRAPSSPSVPVAPVVPGAIPEKEPTFPLAPLPTARDYPLTPLLESGPSTCNPINRSHEMGPSFWTSGEYLLWWVKNAPLPPIPGQPSPPALNLGAFAGVRATAGAWLDPAQRLGIEGSGFVLESRSSSAAAAANLTDTPLLTAGTRLWGAEANGVFSAFNNERVSLALLSGFRYLDLSESLNLESPTNVPTTGSDCFATRNQFYGGQLGARGELKVNQYFVSVTGKAALGDVHQSVSVPGATVVAGYPGTRHTNDAFAVIPEAQVQVGMDITRNVRGYIGYSVLYVSDTVAPLAPFNQGDFWTHGVQFGLAFKF
jgi:Putative beta barrel porin-7 (BBP7)